MRYVNYIMVSYIRGYIITYDGRQGPEDIVIDIVRRTEKYKATGSYHLFKQKWLTYKRIDEEQRNYLVKVINTVRDDILAGREREHKCICDFDSTDTVITYTDGNAWLSMGVFTGGRLKHASFNYKTGEWSFDDTVWESEKAKFKSRYEDCFKLDVQRMIE